MSSSVMVDCFVFELSAWRCSLTTQQRILPSIPLLAIWWHIYSSSAAGRSNITLAYVY